MRGFWITAGLAKLIQHRGCLSINGGPTRGLSFQPAVEFRQAGKLTPLCSDKRIGDAAIRSSVYGNSLNARENGNTVDVDSVDTPETLAYASPFTQSDVVPLELLTSRPHHRQYVCLHRLGKVRPPFDDRLQLGVDRVVIESDCCAILRMCVFLWVFDNCLRILRREPAA